MKERLNRKEKSTRRDGVFMGGVMKRGESNLARKVMVTLKHTWAGSRLQEDYLSIQ